MIGKIQSSVTAKLVIATCLLLITFTLGLLLMNRLWLDEYYVKDLKTNFSIEAGRIQEAFESEKEGVLRLMRQRSSILGYRYALVDREGFLLLSSSPEFVQGYGMSLPAEAISVMDHANQLKKGDRLFTLKPHSDSGEALALMLVDFGGGTYLLISEEVFGINRSAAVANAFYLRSGLVLLCLFMSLTYVLSKRQVKPILALEKLAGEIADQNFSHRYQDNRIDELGILGKRMNHISDSLSSAIDTLERQNQRLEEDMNLQRRFLASVSHDFKSPVGLIQGYAESIKLGYYDSKDELEDFAETIVSEGERLNRLVEDVMMLAKLDVNQFELELAPIDLNPLIHEVLDRYSQEIADGDIKVEVDLHQPLMVMGDHGRMVQIFDNLMSNACRYTVEGGTLSLTSFRKGGLLMIRWTNSTRHTMPEDINDLLKAFVRGELSRNSVTGGHGLGLTIIKGLIEAHGGHVSLIYDEGSFTVTLTFNEQ